MLVLEYNGRTFRSCPASRQCISDLVWASKVLAAPAVTFPNGRDSHEVAGEVIDKAEDALINYLCLVVTA